MSEIKLSADSGGGTTSLKGPASTTGNAALAYTLPNVTTGGVIRTTTTPGAILQVTTTSDSARTDTATTSISTAWTDTTITASITPSSTSSKILVSGFLTGEGNAVDHQFWWRVNRSISGGSATALTGAAASNRLQVFGVFLEGAASDAASTPTSAEFGNYLDSPSTTSAVSYTFQIYYNGAATWYVNRTVSDSDHIAYERSLSYITLMEVAG